MLHELRQKFDRYCVRHRSSGIPNLMLWIIIGNAIVWVLRQIDPSDAVYRVLCFDRGAILKGQVWRLVSYVFTDLSSSALGFGLLWEALIMYCYYLYAQVAERVWGTFRFNVFYFTGILLLDAAAMLTGVPASAYYLNLSLFLVIAGLAPEQTVRLFYILPIKMKYLGWVDIVLSLITSIQYMTAYGFTAWVWIMPLVPLVNFLIFIGANIRNLLPLRARSGKRIRFQKNYQSAQKAAGWTSSGAPSAGTRAYRHKCTVCGRTDADNPNLEFRYCSKCNGYYCYCIDHISNHAHIQ